MTFIYFFDLLGTFAFAISGALLGVRKEMDLYGYFVLAFVVACGGGTIRDMMLNTSPFIFNDPNYLYVTVAAVVLVFLFNNRVEQKMKYLIWMDAVGLGVFTVIGATKAISAGLGWYAVILCAVLTSTGGGMIRDVLANEIPFVLSKEVYASASILGAIIFLGFNKINFNSTLSILITAVVVIAVRMITFKRNKNLPRRHNKAKTV
ncbi:MAG: trimeric intracellular cation channel family protein [Deferribacteraceae bacterium]|jgi:uncharacterized membrane protein YeiH|nr:trimeric intracellular cation channel family protein [Deferribacteraceae bacterium]